MQIVILCAGQGSRLGMNIPKCLVKINKITILENIVHSITQYDKTAEFIVVTGYKEELVEQEVRRLQSSVHSFIRTVHNKYADKFSIMKSLIVAAPLIHDEKVFRISGDVMFDKINTLDLLLKQPISCIAIQKSPESRSKTPTVNFTLNSDLLNISLEDTTLNHWEWADYELYRNHDFQKSMVFADEYIEIGHYHFQLLNRCIQEGIPIQVRGIKGSFEIDTPRDLEYVQRIFSNS